MTIETVTVTDRIPVPWTTKINPIWWLHGPDGWEVPEINNGKPYLPEVKNMWLRRFYWFGCRNPLMNFVGYVLGVEDQNYTATGPTPVMRTTGRDCVPPQIGWRWAVLKAGWRYLPFVSYWGDFLWTSRRLEFYFGWRPSSGGFGLKIVFPKRSL